MNVKSYIEESQLVVHSGGLGERWRPVTNGEVVKPMTEIGKKPRPMIDWAILPFVKAGVKNIFPTLWYKSESVMKHFDEVTKHTGIKFTYLIEPENRRLGRAGIIKESIKSGILDPNKPIISINGSDIICLNLEDMVKFHLEGVKMGYGTTIIASDKMVTEFGILVVNLHTKNLVKFKEKPILNLPRDQKVHTGMFLFDPISNKEFLKIDENSYPINIEDLKGENGNIINKARVYTGTIPNHILPVTKWVFFKSPKHYKEFGSIDFEKFLQVKDSESYLGKYKKNV
jgi:NDP-sugar pyrophosphorylase family protein